MDLLVTVLVVALVCWLVFYVMDHIPMTEPVRTVAYVVVGVILLLFVLSRFGIIGSFR